MMNLLQQAADFRAKLKRGCCYGVFSKTTDSSFVEAAGVAGLDFIILDLEHGPASQDVIMNHVRAACTSGLAPVVRVAGLDAHAIGSALDGGASGVQVPNISSAEEARVAVQAARFAPSGARGVCRFVKAAGFGAMARDEYFRRANDSLLILQVEGVEGIRRIDDILAVPGFDVLFVGPYDLSQSLGIPGQIDAPAVMDLAAQVRRKAADAGMHLGIFTDTLELRDFFESQGFVYLAHSVDVHLYMNALRAISRKALG